MTDKVYKVIISGDVANDLLAQLPETAWLNDMRLSPIVVYVKTSGNSERRNDDIDAGIPARIEDEHTYMMEVMSLDEGTFPDFVAHDVTKKGWSI